MNTPFTKTGYIKPTAPPQKGTKALEAVGAPSQWVTQTPFRLPQNIFMQEQMPSCVAHTVTELVMFAWWKKTGNWVKLSPRFVYALCKQYDGFSADAGTTYEAAFKVIENYGICEDSYFTNDCTLDVNTYTDASLIPQTAKDNALQYKATGNFLADLSVGGLQEAIYQHGMIGIGTDISDYWWLPDWGDVLPLKPFDTQNPNIGGHAVSLYAYGMPWDAESPTNFWVVNHWSSDWGYKGRGCYGANYEPTVYEAVFITLDAQNAPSDANTAENVAIPTPSVIPNSIEVVIEDVVKVVESVL